MDHKCIFRKGYISSDLCNENFHCICHCHSPHICVHYSILGHSSDNIGPCHLAMEGCNLLHSCIFQALELQEYISHSYRCVMYNPNYSHRLLCRSRRCTSCWEIPSPLDNTAPADTETHPHMEHKTHTCHWNSIHPSDSQPLFCMFQSRGHTDPYQLGIQTHATVDSPEETREYIQTHSILLVCSPGARDTYGISKIRVFQ